MSITQYHELEDLSGLSDYKEITSPDDKQKLEEYCSILSRLEDIRSNLAYYDRPIKEVSSISKKQDRPV